jgi:hypothetical protein
MLAYYDAKSIIPLLIYHANIMKTPCEYQIKPCLYPPLPPPAFSPPSSGVPDPTTIDKPPKKQKALKTNFQVRKQEEEEEEVRWLIYHITLSISTNLSQSRSLSI